MTEPLPSTELDLPPSGASGNEAEDEPQPGTDRPESKSILIVDDAPEVLKILQADLEKSGFQADTLSSGEEALQRIAAEPPDLLLLDLILSGMDGYEVSQKIRENETASRLPIIVITALQDIGWRVRALDLGADDLLQKPFDHKELLTRIKIHLRIADLQEVLRERANELADANKALEKAQDKLIQAKKLEATLELAGAINHELNQPFTVIMGQAQLVMGTLPSDHPAFSRLEAIRRNTEKMAEIVQKLENLKSYRTKAYTGSARILDLDATPPQ